MCTPSRNQLCARWTCCHVANVLRKRVGGRVACSRCLPSPPPAISFSPPPPPPPPTIFIPSQHWHPPTPSALHQYCIPVLACRNPCRCACSSGVCVSACIYVLDDDTLGVGVDRMVFMHGCSPHAQCMHVHGWSA